MLTRLSRLVTVGVIVGLGLSVWGSRFVESLIYGVEPRDPATLVAAVVVLCAIGFGAAWLPARHAARVDPVFAHDQGRVAPGGRHGWEAPRGWHAG